MILPLTIRDFWVYRPTNRELVLANIVWESYWNQHFNESMDDAISYGNAWSVVMDAIETYRSGRNA